MSKNYKKLRTTMRSSSGLAAMREHHSIICSRINVLFYTPNLKPNQAKALHNIKVSLDDFVEACIACAENSIERSVCIEKQIDTHNFAGELHEEYHIYSQKLQSSYNSAVQNAKRLSNAIASFVYESLSHTQRRSLRPGSFGRLYNSLKDKKLDLRTNNKKLNDLLLKDGKYFEEIIHEFRDKVLEHTKPNSSVDFSQMIIKHDSVDMILPILRLPHKMPELDSIDPMWRGYVYSEARDKRGKLKGHIYYVHTHIRTDIKSGDQVKAGEPLGVTTDGGSGHFDKFGPHTHTYESHDYRDHHKVDEEMQFNMPGVGELMFRYLEFCDKLLACFEQPD